MVGANATVLPAPRTGRMRRGPRHVFQIGHEPFVLQPFMIAPVLPGETLKSGMMQVRAVTDPISNPIVGWHLEHYFFYVKHRDLDIRDDLAEMMLDIDKDLSAHYGAADQQTYHPGSGIDWMRLCYDRIVATYFRSEGDLLTPTKGGLSKVAINYDFIGQNLTNAADYQGDIDMSVAVDPGAAGEGDESVSMQELSATMRMYEMQRAHGFTKMSYDDWLATYGVTSPVEENHIPELIRYIRDWQYPTNTIDPATGAPSSAVSWALAERMDKDRFFREPGFVVGVTCARPKVYLRNQAAAGVFALQDAMSWLPAIMRPDPWTSVRHSDNGSGLFPTNADAGGYWLDVKDLFIHGDQFTNMTRSEQKKWNFVSIPAADGGVLFPSDVDITDLFAAAEGGGVVRQDGVVQLSILGALQDTTPTLRSV